MGESAAPGVAEPAESGEVTRSARRRRDDTAQRTHEAQFPRLPPLTVGIRHASLEHAPYRLVLGHFQGLPLTGAEARLNERSDGRLERLLLTNLYPQRLGEIVILDPVDEAPPQGAVILGLGPSGELTATELRGVVTRALVRVALNVLDHRLVDDSVEALCAARPLGVSAVLVGSSDGGGLTVASSVRALTDGVLGANATLSRLSIGLPNGQHPATDVVRYDILELIERYEDRVDLVVGVLAKQQKFDTDQADEENPQEQRDRDRLQSVTYRLKPEPGEGRTSANPPIDASGDIWRRVDIRSVEHAATATVELEFTAIGRLARAERVFGEIERAIVDRVVDAAIHDPSNDNVGGALFELLIPQALKGDLGSGENLQLIVGPEEADLPWELLRARPQDNEQQMPLALRVSLLRQFREDDRLRFTTRRASRNNVLVIGNPPSAGLPPLGRAAAEARTVAAMFSPEAETKREASRDQGTPVDEPWFTTSMIWPPAAPGSPSGTLGVQDPDPMDALYNLLNGDWRVIHIAAHGEFTGDRTSTGIVLGPVHLTANIFSKLAVVPDLVMLNACHLGRVGEGPPLTGANRSAASVARELVRLGVRAVVVAGWAVDDSAAELFAKTLYGRLLEGADFGDAVTAARLATWNTHRGLLTWGAYQCYGDPGFRLAPGSSHGPPAPINTVGELRRRVQQLYAWASDQGRSTSVDPTQAMKRLRKSLKDLEIAADRLEAVDVLGDLAAVWAELLDFERAIPLYERALTSGGSSVPMHAVEQIGNLLIRQASERHRGGQDDVAELIEKARMWLDQALAVGKSGERYALLGSYHKKCATMTTGAERLEHIKSAITCYAQANAVQPKPYHELNARQLAAVCRLCGSEAPPKPVKPISPTAESSADGAEAHNQKPESAPDFWERSRQGDLLLTQLLQDGGRTTTQRVGHFGHHHRVGDVRP